MFMRPKHVHLCILMARLAKKAVLSSEIEMLHWHRKGSFSVLSYYCPMVDFFAFSNHHAFFQSGNSHHLQRIFHLFAIQ